MEEMRAIQQFALLTRDVLGRYSEFGWGEEHQYTAELAGDLIALTPFHKPGGSLSGAGYLVLRISDRLLESGILWLAARGHEIAAGLLKDDPESGRLALRSSVYEFSIIGGWGDVLRVLTRCAPDLSDPDGRALLACLEAFPHAYRGRSGVARRMLRNALAPELALSSAIRAEGLLLAAYNEVIGGNTQQARILIGVAGALSDTEEHVREATQVLLAYTSALDHTQDPVPFISHECAWRLPFIIPWGLAVEAIARARWSATESALEPAFASVASDLPGHWSHGCAHGIVSGMLGEIGDGKGAAEHRREALDDLYVAGLRMDVASLLLNRIRGHAQMLTRSLRAAEPTVRKA